MSNFFNLNLVDLAKGFIVAGLTVILTGLYEALSAGAFPSLAQLAQIGSLGLAAGIAYLIKNLFTNSSGKPFKTESK